jgi:YbgC/YbaW family acyl-CoA thioester hydrolase
MQELKKLLESKARIRFHDCDPFNHLNNSRYLDYMMAARGDQLMESYGFDIYQLGRDKGIGWVTAMTQISYRAPAYLNEVVRIQTRLLAFSEKSLQFEASMWDEDRTVIKALMWVKLVHFNLVTQRSQSHPVELMEFFDRVVDPLPDATNFEARLASF